MGGNRKARTRNSRPLLKGANTRSPELEHGWNEKTQQILKAYRRRMEAATDLPDFYQPYLKRDAWLVLQEALPLALGANPLAEWSYVAGEFGPTEEELAPLVSAAVKVNKLNAQECDDEPDWYVKPSEFLRWFEEKGYEVFEPLKSASKSIEPKNGLTISLHGNAERYAQIRELVLQAALGCINTYPEKCKRNGQIVGAQIAKLIETKSPIWFGEVDPPSIREMTKLINKALKSIQE